MFTWWKVFGYRAYPKITTLTKDFLLVCATTAMIERFFSSEKGIITHTRSKLNAKSITALMTLKGGLQQARFENRKLVDSDDEIDIINEKALETLRETMMNHN